MPKKCAAEGGWSVLSRFCSNGSYGVENGEMIAITTSSATITRPTIASLLRR